MIKLIVVGNQKERYLKDATEEYKKRISKYTKIEIIEIKDEGQVDEKKALKIEGEKIKHYITEKDYVITMEIEGKKLNSQEFAEKLRKVQIDNSNITFIVGGSYGLDEEIKKSSNFPLSFSSMTFPHQLFRILLLEQIYRAYKINNNETYHK